MSNDFKYAIFTNNGGRKVNEDYVGAFRNAENNCFVLCDGLGGHGMGDVASRLVVDVQYPPKSSRGLFVVYNFNFSLSSLVGILSP